MLTLRKILPDDLPEVVRIEQSAFADPWPEEAFSKDIMENGYALFDGSRLVGYTFVLTVLDECSIINVAVDPEDQNRGHGEHMLRELMKILTVRKGIRRYFLDVRESNLPARSLYRKLGFFELGIRKNYYNLPPENAVVMGLILPSRRDAVS
ncbi:MAG TPA: ribosomal protein S18-alanine N-acetyltransferase [Candidatus Cloacimonadota bacterium]|nr:ribosomal protein S18-alanine N-acetyltransferase [Candidatus Cloacimonadota bacterium]HPS38194.1 ribosomal protein S18-alanine N-acetyltransferase [Candidatus Cloacimonadota bacterium]